MSLDHLAGAATRELLEQVPPDADRLLGDLKRTRRRRAVTRSVTVLAALALVMGAVALADRGDDGPDPAPNPRNGAIVAPPDNSAGAWRAFTDFGAQLHLPQDAAPFASAQFTADGTRLVYPGPRRSIRAVDVTHRRGADAGGLPGRHVLPQPVPRRHPAGVRRRGAPQDPDRRHRGCRAGPHPRSEVHQHARLVARRHGDRVRRPAWPLHGRPRVRRGPAGAPVRQPPVGLPRAELVARTGRTIAFLDQRPRPGPNHEFDFTATTVRADGTGLRAVHDAGHCACLGLPAPSLTWSPDGELLAVAVTQGEGGAGIYTVRPDGSGWALLHSGIYGDVDWQPVGD